MEPEEKKLVNQAHSSSSQKPRQKQNESQFEYEENSSYSKNREISTDDRWKKNPARKSTDEQVKEYVKV